MDILTLKSSWLFVGVCFLFTVISAQDLRSQPRRKLPTVIITREHLRQQRPQLYGAYGDTAAEFVVSAGLNTNKSTAVRIRRLGNDALNNTTAKQTPGDISNTGAHNIHRTVVANEPNRRHYIPNLHPQINRRHHVEFSDQRHRAPNPNVNLPYPNAGAAFNRPYQQYIPPIFVPLNELIQRTNIHSRTHNKQQSVPFNIPQTPQHFRPEIHPEKTGDTGRPQNNLPYPEYLRPGSGSLNSDQHPRPHVSHSHNPIRQSEETNIGGENHLNRSSESDNRKQTEQKEEINKQINVNGISQQQNPLVKTTESDKNIVAETPVLRLKAHEIQNRIIRKPALVVRDQITVNEVMRRADQPRYGPRALQHDETPTRRKRDVLSYDHLEDNSNKSFQNRTAEVIFDDSDERNENIDSTEMLEGSLEASTQGSDYHFYDYESHERGEENFEKHSQASNRQMKSLEDTSNFTTVSLNAPAAYYFNENTSDVSHIYPNLNSENVNGQVMSFSDFLASPIAEKMRLERQFFFRNTNESQSSNLTTESSQASGRFFMQNTTIPLLKKIVVARLLQGILSLKNSSNNSTISASASTQTNQFRSVSDKLSTAEQRQFGIVVSPYDDVEDLDTRSSMPIIRILRGKIVPLPELPQELIPIILGTYKPAVTKHINYPENTKLSENIIDNALFNLLQSEDILNIRPLRSKVSLSGHRANRKSPSTNHIGSLKSSEPHLKQNLGYKPSDWQLGPRCDRLTEEICLDDSDYPSSAIMSSIYKDKVKFDLMYAELKVRESQVEGLSRKQEQAYSFDHYYGQYPQGAGTNLVPRDYGPHGGFVCPSEVHYGRPHRAKNRKGEWKVVVNVGEYTQTVRMEKCLASGSPCKYVVSHMQSSCSQVYSYHRLLVFNKEMGLHVDLFRIPTACACHLRPGQHTYTGKYSAPPPYHHRPNNYEEFGGHVETAPGPQVLSEGSTNSDKKNSFSNTLWAILGGSPQASQLAQQPQFLDEVQKQISWAQQLKQFPQLLKQISPNQVLKQLLEEDEEDDHSIRRQRVRTKSPHDRLSSHGFSSQPIPISIPLPPPPPPPKVISRRPIVSVAPADKKLFGLSSEGHPKIIAVASPEPPKVFSLTKESHPGHKIVRGTGGDNGQKVTLDQAPSTDLKQVNAFKIQPGMYPPKIEKQQVPESSMVPIAPQFSDQSFSDMDFRAVMKPMPAPKGSDKDAVDDEDLVAVEKSAGEENHGFKLIESAPEKSEPPKENNELKINFSYHPILEYLNM